MLGIRREADRFGPLPRKAGARVVMADRAGVKRLANRVEIAGANDGPRLLAIDHIGVGGIGRDDAVVHHQWCAGGRADYSAAVGREGDRGPAANGHVACPLAEVAFARPAVDPVDRGDARSVGAEADGDVERGDRLAGHYRRELIGDGWFR